MDGSGLNFDEDVNVNLTKLSERMRVLLGKVDALEETVYGNGHAGLKATVAEIQHHINAIDKERKENEVSKNEKRGMIFAVVLLFLGEYVPHIAKLFGQ
jgi:hypothetical protein